MRGIEILVAIIALIMLRAIDVKADEEGANWKVKSKAGMSKSSQNLSSLILFFFLIYFIPLISISKVKTNSMIVL